MYKAVLLITIILFSIIVTLPARVTHIPPPPSFNSLPKHIQTQVMCIADNIYFEARGEPIKGQIAIGLVTLNRVYHTSYPSTPCQVVRQQANKVCQFSWWCDSDLRSKRYHRRTVEYREIRDLAIDMYFNPYRYKDVTRGALFYHATYVSKRRLGVKNLTKTAHIGNHIFYRTSQ